MSCRVTCHPHVPDGLPVVADMDLGADWLVSKNTLLSVF